MVKLRTSATTHRSIVGGGGGDGEKASIVRVEGQHKISKSGAGAAYVICYLQEMQMIGYLQRNDGRLRANFTKNRWPDGLCEILTANNEQPREDLGTCVRKEKMKGKKKKA